MLGYVLMRSAVVLVGVIGLLACNGAPCPDERYDDPSPSSFSGIEGVVSMIYDPCESSNSTPVISVITSMRSGATPIW